VIYMLLFNSKAVPSRCKPRDAAVDFDKYQHLLRHRAVLFANAKIHVKRTISVFFGLTESPCSLHHLSIFCIADRAMLQTVLPMEIVFFPFLLLRNTAFL